MARNAEKSAKAIRSCALLPKLDLDQAYRSVTVHLDNLKSLICVLQQPPKLLLGPLFRIQHYHHPNVQLTQSSLLKSRLITQFGQYGIVDKQRGSWLALLQSLGIICIPLQDATWRGPQPCVLA